MDMNEKNYVVYCHTTPDGKKYIGITSLNPPSKRFANGLGYRTQTVFYRAIQKYGWENIDHTIILENLTYNEAKEKEQYYIALFKTNCNRYRNPTYGYNMDDGGCSRRSGFHLLESTKIKLANSSYHKNKAIKVNYFNAAGKYIGTANSINEAARFTGVAATNIVKILKGKLFGTLKGYQFQYYNEDDVVNGINNYIHPENHFTIYNNPIYQYSLKGDYIASYKNPRIVEKTLGISSYNVIKCAKGIYNTSCGYIWSFEKKDHIDIKINSKFYSTQSKKINQYDLNGNYMTTYNSISEAQKAMGSPKGRNICLVCMGRRKKAYGFKWEYA
jgi:hypothetical protein